MNSYDRYYNCIIRSVDHIFKNFFNDNTIKEVYKSQSSGKDAKVSIEIDGSLLGEIILNIPPGTLNLLIQKMIPDAKPNLKSLQKHYADVAGELANMITGTFANQLQFVEKDIRLSPPEFNSDPITMKTLYENINISFESRFGGFDVDLYYKEK
ncbi:MAG: chemotaxis protein CheX [Spirochaetota bacterium]